MRKIITFFIVILSLIGEVWGEDPPVIHKIQISNMRYEPSELKARPGDTIVWENTDLVPHTVTSQDKSVDSGLIQPGKSWSLKLASETNFEYKCMLHPAMLGKIIFGEKE